MVFLRIVFSKTTVTGMATTTETPGVTLPLDRVTTAARALSRAARWEEAAGLLAGAGDDPRLALAAAELAVDRCWYTGTGDPEEALAHARTAGGESFDLGFVELRHAYRGALLVDGRFHAGPEGKDPAVLTAVRRRAEELRDAAPDPVRCGWAEMYLGLVADNLFAERDAAPAHYHAALAAGDGVDDHLAREALRHLGDHDHDAGDHERARERWERSTELAAASGAVLGTLAQQVLLAVLARDAGDEAGALALAREIARWAGAVGAGTLESQALGLLGGVDPTAPPA
jgi:hypothetical protein